MKKILVIGKNGQIGFELCRTLAPLGIVKAVDKSELNLADPLAIQIYLKALRPDIIVNAAAYTNVEKAEEEKEEARKINGEAPAILAEESKKLGAFLVHYSTDYVFDGSQKKPYREEDPPHPLNVYGQTKLEGEKHIQSVGGKYLILRTSWVYGLRGKNFLKTMLETEKKQLNIVNDQVGAPTWSRLIAEATAQLLGREKTTEGLFHLTAQGETTWYGFAKTIFQLAKKNKDVFPITSKDYPSKVQRPSYSVLSNDKIQNECQIVLPSWEQQLLLCLID